MNASRKRLKAFLVPKVRKLGLLLLASKLSKFPLFNNFFFDLANFQDLNNFCLFDFSDFLVYFTLSLSNPILLLRLFLIETNLLLSLLLETSLLLLFLLGAGLSNNIVIFKIMVNEAAILPKP